LLCFVPNSGGYSDGDFEKMKVVVGLELLQPTDVGVFHFEQTDCNINHQTTCTVLSNHGTKVGVVVRRAFF